MSEPGLSAVGHSGRNQSRDARIVLAITNAGDQKVLREWLGDRYEVTVVADAGALEGVTAELYIVDTTTFDRFLDALVAEKASVAPEILPILLVQHESRPPLDAAQREHIDDVVLAPVDQHELAWRIDSLLQKRELSRELAAENERLNEFASSVSHDLRNPLRTAEGYLELAKETGTVAHLDEVETSLDRANAMISDLLELARSGEESLDLSPASLSDIAEDAWMTVATQAATLELDTPPELKCDTSRVRRLLENLFRNAVEHGGENVTVRVGALEDAAGFYVEDDGPGIPGEKRDHVFEQGFSSTDSGTGFGLTHVDEIATVHGWTVTATSARSGGARFEVVTDTRL